MLATLVVLAGLLAGPFGPARGEAAESRDAGPFAGLGAWVDAFDYAPAFQGDAGVVTVTPDSLPDMAALGVKTLFLQAAMNDRRSPGKIVDARLVGEFLRRAHAEGMAVVAWYYPTLDDRASDAAHIAAMAEFTARGQRFDALGLDLEATQSVPDVAERNDRVVALARRTRALVGDQPLGAIVYPAVQTELVNPALWPKFPYRRLAAHVDVWMPMAYWTFRDGTYRDAYAYTAESITRLRANVGDRRALVHPVGGIGDEASAQDYRRFLAAVRDTKSVGWSIYDYNTTATSAWPLLRTGGVALSTRTTAPLSTARQ